MNNYLSLKVQDHFWDSLLFPFLICSSWGSCPVHSDMIFAHLRMSELQVFSSHRGLQTLLKNIVWIPGNVEEHPIPTAPCYHCSVPRTRAHASPSSTWAEFLVFLGVMSAFISLCRSVFILCPWLQESLHYWRKKIFCHLEMLPRDGMPKGVTFRLQEVANLDGNQWGMITQEGLGLS